MGRSDRIAIFSKFLKWVFPSSIMMKDLNETSRKVKFFLKMGHWLARCSTVCRFFCCQIVSKRSNIKSFRKVLVTQTKKVLINYSNCNFCAHFDHAYSNY